MLNVCLFQVYKITFTRKQIPRFIKVSDPALAFQYEDPVSLSVIHRPITILGSKHSFSAQIIDEYTKTSKVNPLDDSPLDAGWRVEDYDLDAKISTSTGSVLLAKGSEFFDRVLTNVLNQFFAFFKALFKKQSLTS